MSVTTTLQLTEPQLERLIELLNDQRGDVYCGSDSGYGQSKEDELSDIDELLGVLHSAR